MQKKIVSILLLHVTIFSPLHNFNFPIRCFDSNCVRCKLWCVLLCLICYL